MNDENQKASDVFQVGDWVEIRPDQAHLAEMQSVVRPYLNHVWMVSGFSENGQHLSLEKLSMDGTSGGGGHWWSHTWFQKAGVGADAPEPSLRMAIQQAIKQMKGD